MGLVGRVSRDRVIDAVLPNSTGKCARAEERKRLRGGWAEEVHRHHQTRIDLAQDLDDVEGLQRIASIHGHQEHIDPTEFLEVLRRQVWCRWPRCAMHSRAVSNTKMELPSYSVADP